MQQFFNTRHIDIPDSVQVIFVADLFVEDYVGGAELTSEALITSSPFSVLKVHSRDVSVDLLERGQMKHWIFGNFSGMDMQLIPTIIANMSYSILEYDYKFCKARSPDKHREFENQECDCHNQWNGKLIATFMAGAKSVWWMSETQKHYYTDRFPDLAKINNTVLSSVFDDKTLSIFNTFRSMPDSNRSGWIVLGSQSWVKGYPAAEKWCKDNNLPYTVVWDIPYDELLEKLATAEGFVYLPAGMDTCPRMVIEAKILGCKLKINDNVQHASEEWFDTDNIESILEYLYSSRTLFWKGIENIMPVPATISGYTTVYNCIKQDYPFEASIKSMLGFCDEVIVVDGGSTDGTWEKIQSLAATEQRLIVHQQPRDWSSKRFAVFDGMQKALARSMCSANFCWQQDSDEVVHENDYQKIRHLAMNFPKEIDLIALPVIEYWGKREKVRMDVTPWKWRISRNAPHITHGIPAELRRYDNEGNLYSAKGSDGCDYVRFDNYAIIPCANFMTNEVESARQYVLQSFDENVRQQYQSWFKSVISQLPSVHHYSWFDMGRKIRTYRDYWTKHWLSLYDIFQADTIENNMFFNKPWSQVTEAEIDALAIRLERDMGGWIFHKKLDFSRRTPHLFLGNSHPAEILNWIQMRTK